MRLAMIAVGMVTALLVLGAMALDHGEIITLITCGGTFDSNASEYDQRVIVRAARIYDDASETIGAGTNP